MVFDIHETRHHLKVITKVFQELRKKKHGSFFARQNHLCCQSCGWAETPNTKNIVFFHNQDYWRFRETGVLFLAWQGDAHKIVELFEKEGVEVVWDGTNEERIKLKNF